MVKRLLIAILVLAGLALSACGAEDEASKKLTGRRESQTTPTSEPTVSEAISDFSGNLIYVADNNIYQWSAGENELLAEGIDTPSNIRFTPDRTHLMYSLPDPLSTNNGPSIHLVDLKTHKTAQLFKFPNGAFGRQALWRVHSWSPDQQWMLLVGTNFFGDSYLVDIDGTTSQLVAAAREAQIWLDDNRLLVFEWNGSTDNPGALKNARIWTPGSTDPLQLDIDNIDDLETYLTDEGLETTQELRAAAFVQPQGYIALPHFDSGQTYCGNWVIQHDGDAVYTIEDVGGITDIQVGKDGAFYFIRWTFPDCVFLQRPVGELVKMTPDGEITVLAEGLGLTADRNNLDATRPFDGNDGSLHRYSLSPDESQVAWIGYSEDEATSTLYVTELDTMATQAITSIPGRAEELINMVYWVAL